MTEERHGFRKYLYERFTEDDKAFDTWLKNLSKETFLEMYDTFSEQFKK